MKIGNRKNIIQLVVCISFVVVLGLCAGVYLMFFGDDTRHSTTPEPIESMAQAVLIIDGNVESSIDYFEENGDLFFNASMLEEYGVFTLCESLEAGKSKINGLEDLGVAFGLKADTQQVYVDKNKLFLEYIHPVKEIKEDEIVIIDESNFEEYFEYRLEEYNIDNTFKYVSGGVFLNENVIKKILRVAISSESISFNLDREPVSASLQISQYIAQDLEKPGYEDFLDWVSVIKSETDVSLAQKSDMVTKEVSYNQLKDVLVFGIENNLFFYARQSDTRLALVFSDEFTARLCALFYEHPVQEDFELAHTRVLIKKDADAVSEIIIDLSHTENGNIFNTVITGQ